MSFVPFYSLAFLRQATACSGDQGVLLVSLMWWLASLDPKNVSADECFSLILFDDCPLCPMRARDTIASSNSNSASAFFLVALYLPLGDSSLFQD